MNYILKGLGACVIAAVVGGLFTLVGSLLVTPGSAMFAGGWVGGALFANLMRDHVYAQATP